jgi:hypothetical protein
VVLGLAVLALTACSGGGSDESASTATTATTAPPASAPTAPPNGCPGFTGSTTMLASTGPTAPAQLNGAVAGANGCLDQVTLTFNGDGVPPGYVVGYRDPEQEPFLDGDPPEPIEVPGNAFLVVKVTPALSYDPLSEDKTRTYTGNLSLEYGDHHHLQIVRELPDTADSVMWVIGLDSVRPFRVDRAADPRRVTVLIG